MREPLGAVHDKSATLAHASSHTRAKHGTRTSRDPPVYKGEYQRTIIRFMALICRYTGAARRLDPAWVEDRLEKRVMELMTFSQETSGASPPPPSLVAHTARVARYIDRKQRSDRLIISSFEHRTAAVVIWIRYYRPFVCDWVKA